MKNLYAALLILVVSTPAVSMARNDRQPNTSPEAYAGEDTEAAEGAEITLTGTCNDADTEDHIRGSWDIVEGSCAGPPGNPVRTDELGRFSDRPRTIAATCTAPDVDSDSFITFELSCSDGTESAADTVTVYINAAPNRPPECTVDVEGARQNTDKKKNLKMPDINCTDEDGDEVRARWIQVGDAPPGKELHFTDDNEIDLTTYRYKRGKYYAQMIAADNNGNTTAGDIVWINMPNNPPEFAEGEEGVEGMRLENRGGQYKYVPDTFKNFISISAPVSDFDDDGMSITWRVTRGLDGFLDVTEDGTGAKIRIRNAGTTIVEATADDGYGGKTVEEFIIYQPPPEIEEETLNMSAFIISTGSPTSLVIGHLGMPVVPIISVEGVEAEVSLANISTLELIKADEDVLHDTYTFRAKDVPISDSTASLYMDISTDVDGDEALLISKSISIREKAMEGGEEDPTGYGTDSGGGCSLTHGRGAAKTDSMAAFFILLICPIAIFLRGSKGWTFFPTSPTNDNRVLILSRVRAVCEILRIS